MQSVFAVVTEMRWDKNCYLKRSLRYINTKHNRQIILKECSTFLTLIYFQVYDKDKKREVGKISKQWSGLIKEMFTDADNFGVSCKYSL